MCYGAQVSLSSLGVGGALEGRSSYFNRIFLERGGIDD